MSGASHSGPNAPRAGQKSNKLLEHLGASGPADDNEMEPRRERCFSVHDVAAALQQVALRRGACEPQDVLRALCELFPAAATEHALLSDVQQGLEEGVVLGIVARVGNRYCPAGFPGVHGDKQRALGLNMVHRPFNAPEPEG